MMGVPLGAIFFWWGALCSGIRREGFVDLLVTGEEFAKAGFLE